MGEMMTLMLSGRKKNSVLNRLTKHLLQSCSMHNTSLYISWGQKKKNYKMLGGDSSNGSRLPVFCLCTTVPANRKCLITGAAYTYRYSLAHLVSSVALWHPHCGFTTFLYSSARLQALHLQMFSLCSVLFSCWALNRQFCHLLTPSHQCPYTSLQIFQIQLVPSHHFLQKCFLGLKLSFSFRN